MKPKTFQIHYNDKAIHYYEKNPNLKIDLLFLCSKALEYFHEFYWFTVEYEDNWHWKDTVIVKLFLKNATVEDAMSVLDCFDEWFIRSIYMDKNLLFDISC